MGRRKRSDAAARLRALASPPSAGPPRFAGGVKRAEQAREREAESADNVISLRLQHLLAAGEQDRFAAIARLHRRERAEIGAGDFGAVLRPPHGRDREQHGEHAGKRPPYQLALWQGRAHGSSIASLMPQIQRLSSQSTDRRKALASCHCRNSESRWLTLMSPAMSCVQSTRASKRTAGSASHEVLK